MFPNGKLFMGNCRFIHIMSSLVSYEAGNHRISFKKKIENENDMRDKVGKLSEVSPAVQHLPLLCHKKIEEIIDNCKFANTFCIFCDKSCYII